MQLRLFIVISKIIYIADEHSNQHKTNITTHTTSNVAESVS